MNVCGWVGGPWGAPGPAAIGCGPWFRRSCLWFVPQQLDAIIVVLNGAYEWLLAVEFAVAGDSGEEVMKGVYAFWLGFGAHHGLRRRYVRC